MEPGAKPKLRDKEISSIWSSLMFKFYTDNPKAPKKDFLEYKVARSLLSFLNDVYLCQRDR